MNGVTFVKFPSKHNDVATCRKWVKACGRMNFAVEKVTRDTYICTKHFHGGNGPTAEYPDPLPCGISGPELRNHLYKTKRRKLPVKRTAPATQLPAVTYTPATSEKTKENRDQTKKQVSEVFIDHNYVSTVEVEVHAESDSSPQSKPQEPPDKNNNSGNS